MTNAAAITNLTSELLRALARLLDTDALLALEQTSRELHVQLRDVVAARCKRECFGRFLHATIATHRMLAPVPEVTCAGVRGRIHTL